MAQVLLLTLRGTPTAYYGDELGLEDGSIPPEMAHDPQEILSPGHGRDPERTPMQWDASPHAGFSTVEPWLPIADPTGTCNVAAQRDDPASMLTIVHRLIETRRTLPALSAGSQRTLDTGHADVLAYLRVHEHQRVVVALNFGDQPRTLHLAGERGSQGSGGALRLSTSPGRLAAPVDIDLANLTLAAHEAVIVELR